MTTEEGLVELGRALGGAVQPALERLEVGAVEQGTVHVPDKGDSPLLGMPVPAVVTSVSYSDGVTGDSAFVFGRGSFHLVAGKMLGKEPAKGEPDELQLSAVAEVANQMMVAAATAIGSMLEQELTIGPPETRQYAKDREAAAAFKRTPHALFVPFTIDGEPCRLVQFVPNSLAVRVTQAVEQHGAQASIEGGGGIPGDALRDVSLHVRAELGRTRLPLAQALDLPSGAVVELDRAPDDPVDLYVNGRRFARGRLIVIEDEWAVEIETVGSAEAAG